MGHLDALIARSRRPGHPVRPGRAAVDSLRRALEKEVELVASGELQRNRALLASLAPADREAISVVAHRVATGVAAYLVAEARRDEHVARVLAGRF